MTHALVSRPITAAIYMLIAMLIIGVIDNFIAVIARDISLWQFQILRGLMALVILGVVALLGFSTLRPNRWRYVALRSMAIAIGMLFYFGALAFMPIAQALAGLFTAPIFVLLVTAFILRQPIGPIRIFAVGLGFVGILLVLDPDWSALRLITFVPVIGGFFYALGTVATRHLCADEPTVAMLAGLMLCQIFVSLVAMAVLFVMNPDVAEGTAGFLTRGWIWMPSDALPWVLLQAAGSLIGVGLIIRSYQMAEPSYVTIYEYSVFIFGPMAAWVMFDQTIGFIQVAGICLIAFAGILIAFRSR